MLLLTVSALFAIAWLGRVTGSNARVTPILQLYLLGRSRLNALNRGDTIARGGRKTFKLFVCFIPTLVATWVAITRSVDNWHHYSDILAGSIIGAVSACIGYFYNYGGIFGRDTAGVTLEEMKLRYRVRCTSPCCAWCPK